MDNIVSWKYQRELPRAKTDAFELALEHMEPAIDVGEVQGNDDLWVFTAFFDATTPRTQLVASIETAEKVAGVNDEAHPVVLQGVQDEDWQSNVIHSFPPVVESGFFIYGFDAKVPEDKVGLHVPAGMAFGTGEHATTALCLRLYEEQTAKRTFKNALDMGAGSGILAMAAAKVQKTPVLAVEIDPPSTEVCHENAVNNCVEQYVTSICGDGFNAPGVDAREPYDLIFANILRNPLLEMAEGLVNVLDKGGIAILSGFTVEQRDDIREAYGKLGLTEVATAERDNWTALCMTK